MYKIQVKTLQGNMITFSVNKYTISEGDFVEFEDLVTGEKKLFHSSNCEIKEVPGKEPLDQRNLRKFRKIVELYRDDIIRKWIDFFIYNIEIQTEKITRKI